MTKKIKAQFGSKSYIIAFALAFAVIGIATILFSRAATINNTFEPETGTLSSNAKIASSATASGGSYVSFNAQTGTSADGTTITPGSGTIIDTTGGRWTITSGKVVQLNGANAAFSAGVTLVLWYKGTIYHTSPDGWYSWTNGDWADVAGDPRVAPPPPPPGCGDGVLYCEDFSNGPGAFVAGGTPHFNGTSPMIVSGGKAYCNGAASAYGEYVSQDCIYRYSKAVNSSNYWVEVDMVMGNNPGDMRLKAGLLARYTDSTAPPRGDYQWINFFLYHEPWGDGAELLPVINSTIQDGSIVSASPQPQNFWNSTVKQRLEIRGNQVTGFINGRQVLSTNTPVPASPWVGFYGESAVPGEWAFDNFKVGLL